MNFELCHKLCLVDEIVAYSSGRMDGIVVVLHKSSSLTEQCSFYVDAKEIVEEYNSMDKHYVKFSDEHDYDCALIEKGMKIYSMIENHVGGEYLKEGVHRIVDGGMVSSLCNCASEHLISDWNSNNE